MFNINYETSESAAKALDRIKHNRAMVITESDVANNRSAVSRERDFLDEFTEEDLASKLKSDKYIYEHILGNLEDNEAASAIFESLISSMTNVYKLLNVAPVQYQFTESDIVNNSEKQNSEKAREIVESFMRDNLHCLSQEQRDTKYREKVVSLTHELIENHNAAPAAAVDMAYKSVVVESLLNTMHFPKFVSLYLEECLTSDKYAEFFESDTLDNAYNEYKKNAHLAAQLIATTL